MTVARRRGKLGFGSQFGRTVALAPLLGFAELANRPSAVGLLLREQLRGFRFLIGVEDSVETQRRPQLQNTRVIVRCLRFAKVLLQQIDAVSHGVIGRQRFNQPGADATGYRFASFLIALDSNGGQQVSENQVPSSFCSSNISRRAWSVSGELL